MDAWVQMIRNALCCIKDLKLFSSSALWDASVLQAMTNHILPPPLNKATPLEFIISITQFYAFLSVTKSGFLLIVRNVGKLRRIYRLVEQRTLPTTLADRLINSSLYQEANRALRSIFIGICVMPIGLAFWWLFCNSWHITTVDWFGGLPALIHALEVMELCLLPLLFYMIVDGLERLSKASQMKVLLNTIQSSHGMTRDMLTLQYYEGMTGWAPFWEAGVGWFTTTLKADQDQKQLVEEAQKLERALETLFPPSDDMKGKDDTKQNKKDDQEGEKEEKIRLEAWDEIQQKLKDDIPVLRMAGYREFLYFLFNFFAFCGYFMAPLCFYYDDDTQPSFIRSLKFGFKNDDADWYGNFTGDLMWTLEPIVVLTTPYLESYIKPSQRKEEKKVKSD